MLNEQGHKLLLRALVLPSITGLVAACYTHALSSHCSAIVSNPFTQAPFTMLCFAVVCISRCVSPVLGCRGKPAATKPGIALPGPDLNRHLLKQVEGNNNPDVVVRQSDVESRSATAAATQQDVSEQPGSVQMSDAQGELSQQVQEAEHGSVAALLAQLSEPKIEATPGQTHAEVLMAEQRVEAAQLSEGTESAVVRPPDGVVVQLVQHEPTAEEDVSQHMQLQQLPDLSAVGQAVQPDSDVSNAAHNLVDDDATVPDRATEAAAEV